MKKNKKPVVMLDVDGTVVNNIDDWKSWYRTKTGKDLKLSADNEQNLKDALLHHNLDPIDFWKQPDLYDKKIPIPQAGKVISKHKDDFDFVFVSNCFTEHVESKKAFLKRWFGDIPFISTEFKEYISCDICIDDRAYYLRKIKERQPETECIQIVSSTNNYHEEFHYLRWDSIDTFLSEFVVK